MRTHIGVGIVAAMLMASAAALSAHHTAVNFFDTKNLVTLQGTLTRVDWRNPHVILHVETRGDDGNPVTWSVETVNVQGLSLRGLRQDSFKIGETVRMTVCVAKDGVRWAATRAITIAGGTADVSMGGC